MTDDFTISLLVKDGCSKELAFLALIERMSIRATVISIAERRHGAVGLPVEISRNCLLATFNGTPSPISCFIVQFEYKTPSSDSLFFECLYYGSGYFGGILARNCGTIHVRVGNIWKWCLDVPGFNGLVGCDYKASIVAAEMYSVTRELFVLASGAGEITASEIHSAGLVDDIWLSPVWSYMIYHSLDIEYGLDYLRMAANGICDITMTEMTSTEWPRGVPFENKGFRIDYSLADDEREAKGAFAFIRSIDASLAQSKCDSLADSVVKQALNMSERQPSIFSAWHCNSGFAMCCCPYASVWPVYADAWRHYIMK